MKTTKLLTKLAIMACLALILSCLLPFSYFIVFPATEEIAKKATHLHKGLILEFCFNFGVFESDGEPTFLLDIRWAAPGSFAVSMPSPYFTRCGYVPWLPFVEYPEYAFIGIPRFTYKWDSYCLGNCP
jgi:hypothetical protein